MIFNSRKEALKYMQDNDIDTSTLTEDFWQEVNESGAQPEFQIIAEMIYDLYSEATFQENKYHIPFEKDIRQAYEKDIKNLIGVFDYAGSIEECEAAYENKITNYLMLVSASMAAKLSYDTQEKEDTLEKHLERAQLLKTHKHAEPFSHQAIAMDSTQYEVFAKRFVTTKPNWEQQEDCGMLTTGTYVVEELGWCYNNRGFITQRYLIENLQ